MNLQVGVKILLKDDSGKYLLLRRSKEKYPELHGQWDIAGGRIEAGTLLIENLKREIAEETGLDLVGEPELIFAQDILGTDNHVVRLTYTGVASGRIRLSDEHDEYRWFSLDEIKKLDDLDSYVSVVFKEI